MVQYLNKSPVIFAGYVNNEDGKRALAFQFPEENIEFLRLAWKQPKAKPGDWLVKVGVGTINPSHRLYSNEVFQRRFRKPQNRAAESQEIISSVHYATETQQIG